MQPLAIVSYLAGHDAPARNAAQRKWWAERFNATSAGSARIAMLRLQVQQAHPDRGGSAAEFHKAKAALDAARGR